MQSNGTPVLAQEGSSSHTSRNREAHNVSKNGHLSKSALGILARLATVPTAVTALAPVGETQHK